MNNLNENFILTNKDEYINFDKFVNGEEDILYMVGLCGSGKSTTGKEIAKKFNVKYIELDEFEKILISTISLTRLQSLRPKDYYDLLLKKIIEELDGERAIIEGIQILFMDINFFVGKPIVFKNTSFLKSTFRATVRDYKAKGKIEYRRYFDFNFELETLKSNMIKQLKKRNGLG